MGTDAKAALRRELRAKLKAIDLCWRDEASDRAAANIISTPEYDAARTVMLFVPIRAEISTLPIARDLWRTGRRVAVPRAHMEDRSMECIVVRNFGDDMVLTPIGVLEPKGGDCLSPDQLDLVVVPGLGFGPHGERIGRGAGFYDRFLSLPSLRASCCGFGFEMQVVDGIPMTEHDTPLPMLVTEERIRRFD